MSPSKQIAIIGTGYVGMASAIGLAALGHRVVGYDIMTERIRGLAQGVTPYQEPGIAAALGEQLSTGRLHFTEHLDVAVDRADFIIVAVGTPSQPDGSADLSALEAAAMMLAASPATGTVVLRSTVPVGTTERVAASLDGRCEVLYAPEFLREGRAVDDFLNPDRIVIGGTSTEAATAYAALFASLGKPVVVTSLRNAELIKGFSNAFLAAKISFANEVANFCDAADADALEVLRGVGLDARIGSAFLHPGIGFGGPCFEKDLKSLRHQAGKLNAPDDLLAATLRTNDRQPRRVASLLENELGMLAGRKIAVWGLTFKADTDDVRDSLAVRVVDDLLASGAHVRAYDPALAGSHALLRCEIVASEFDALEGADALVILTDWSQFALIDPVEIARRLPDDGVVIDGRNILDPYRIAKAGLRYRGIGRRSNPATAVRSYDGDQAGVIAV